MTRLELAQRIKDKHPAYQAMADDELVDKILAKYPVYADQITDSFDVEDSDISQTEIKKVENNLKPEEQLPIEEKQPEIDIEPIKQEKAKRFDKGIFKMAEREAYDKYKLTGEIDLNLIPKEEDKPSFIEDKLARLARGIASTGKGFEEAKTALFLTGADIAMDLFKPELTNEQKLETLKALKKYRDVAPGSGIAGYESVIESLGKHVREYDSESITDDIANGNYAQAADRAIGGVFESAPSLALAYLGPGGLIALGTSAAGNKFDEEFEENPEEGAKRLFLNSVLSGGAEASFELVTRGILGRATGLIKSGSKKAADELIDSYAKNIIKKLATDPGKEGLSEFATELSVDLIDIATLKGDKWTGLSDFVSKNFKKWTDAGIIGTVTGGGIVTTGALTSNSKAVRDAAEYTLTPESDKKIINDAAIEINSLNEQIKRANNNEAEALVVEIVKQEEKIINTRKKVSEELNMMNPDELKKYAKGIDKVAEERKKLNSFFSPFLRTQTKEEIDELQYQNDQVLRESVDRRLDENIKTVGVEDLGRTVNDYDTKEDYQKAYDNTEFGKKNSMNVTSSDGFIDTEGDIYINKEVAQKVRNVNVAAHELLHGILNNNIKEPGQLKRLVNEFKAILPRETANLIQKRIDDNYRFTTDEQGNRVERPESEYMEEYFTAFADLIGNRKVKFNENIFTKVGEKITPIFKGKGYGHIKFETGKDVYDFIKSYQKQIAKGELAPETIEAAKKVTDQDTKMSRSETTLLDAINNLLPKDINTKEKYDDFIRDERKAKPIVDALNKPGGAINNYIRSKQVSPEEGNEMIQNTLFRLFNFNPEETRADGSVVGPESFGERIFADTRFASLDARKKLAKEAEKKKQEARIDDEEARQVAARDDSESTETAKDRVTPKSKIPREFPEIFDQDIKDEFEKAGLEIYESDLPDMSKKEFKAAILDIFKGKLGKKVKDKLGTRKNYEFVVKKMAPKMKDLLPVQWFVRLEAQTKPEDRLFTNEPTRLTKKADIDKALLDEKVYVENLKQGVNIYEFKDFKAKQLSISSDIS